MRDDFGLDLSLYSIFSYCHSSAPIALACSIQDLQLTPLSVLQVRLRVRGGAGRPSVPSTLRPEEAAPGLIKDFASQVCLVTDAHWPTPTHGHPVDME